MGNSQSGQNTCARFAPSSTVLMYTFGSPLTILNASSITRIFVRNAEPDKLGNLNSDNGKPDRALPLH